MDKLIYFDHSSSGNPTENPNWPEARVHHASLTQSKNMITSHTGCSEVTDRRVGRDFVVLVVAMDKPT